jgi:hypothetical protein
MENPQNLSARNGKAPPLPVPNAANKIPAGARSLPYTAENISAYQHRLNRKTPATPLMMNPTAAWRMICARTGAGIALGSFYRWIRDGRVCAIRMGAKILVPVSVVDHLIEKFLQGEDLP